uniref:Transposase n=1 Tax=Burkholderia orbicola (strain AU 1054) TaxID=331271 RepID=A0A0H2XXI7_BURO1
MPRKPKAQPVELPAIPAELLEQFGNGPMTAEAINAATLALKKALIERALSGEMNHHLGYPAGAAKPANATNQRNGRGAKTVRCFRGGCSTSRHAGAPIRPTAKRWAARQSLSGSG